MAESKKYMLHLATPDDALGHYTIDEVDLADGRDGWVWTWRELGESPESSEDAFATKAAALRAAAADARETIADHGAASRLAGRLSRAATMLERAQADDADS